MASPGIQYRTVRAAVFPRFGRAGAEAGAGLSPEVADALAAARREGFEAGLREGRAQALAAAEGQVTDRAVALAAAAAALDARRAELAAELRSVLPAVVVALVEQILERELPDAAALATDAIAARAARLARRDGPVVLRLAPAGAAALADRIDGVRVTADASLGAADWILETPDGLLDGRLAVRLEGLRRLLIDGADEPGTARPTQ